MNRSSAHHNIHIRFMFSIVDETINSWQIASARAQQSALARPKKIDQCTGARPHYYRDGEQEALLIIRFCHKTTTHNQCKYLISRRPSTQH